MREPTLRQIQAFKAFVETGTVVKAADLLFISQPAVSKLLTHLEADSGLHILDRGHGKMNVTERGMRFYEEIDRIFTGVDQINQAVQTIKKEDRGQLSIGFMPGVPLNLIATVTKIFLEKHPEVYLAYGIRSSQFIVEGIHAKKFDFGIVVKPLDHSEFKTTLLHNGDLVGVVPESHKYASKSILSLKDLCSTPMISFTNGSMSYHVLNKAFIDSNLIPNSILEVTTSLAVLEMVSAGVGISVIHPMFINPKIKGLKIIPLKKKMSLPIHVVRAKNTRRDKLIDDFLDIFNETLNH